MEAGKNYLLNVLSNNDVTFFIPPYQRNYEWDKVQCEVFFDDILKVTKANIKGEIAEHFFGTIVYVQNEAVFGQPSKLVLTDGQQRITTTMLFLVALRDLVESKELKEFIDSKYLKNNNVSDDTEYKIKLKQVETDWEAYRNIILGLELSTENKNSAVYNNYLYFLKRLSELEKSGEIVPIEELIGKGLAKFSIVTIQLEPAKNSWENPQEVFESMNSLGKPLALADLVRNYLLLGKNADEQDELYRKYWLSIEKQLPSQVSNFIRDFMQLKGATDFKKATATNYKELYVNFKELFSELSAEELLPELKRFSKLYAYIVLDVDTGNAKLNSRLADLRIVNVTILYSFLLGLLDSWDKGYFTDSEIVEIIDALIIYFLRRRILRLTQGENKGFPPLVNEIQSLVLADNKKEKMFEILASQENALRLPNNHEVLNELKTMNFYNFNQSKFILSLIEESLTKSRPNKNDKKLQIEHIMPQTLNGIWQEDLGEDFDNVHQSFINNIGNLTLIRHNQELGNKDFQAKKQVYDDHAGLQIAKSEIVNRKKWNKNSILNRMNWISNIIILDILAIPERMQNRNNFSIKKKKYFSFEELHMIGEEIYYFSDPSITATVVSEREVNYHGKNYKLSPLTREIETKKGTVTPSGAYQGSIYWGYKGKRLVDLEEN